MEEIQARLLDDSGTSKVLDEKLLAKILSGKMRQYCDEVFVILRKHAPDRDEMAFAPKYIKWVARGVRDEIERKWEKRKLEMRIAPRWAKKIFAEILAEGSKGFQKDKGKLFIANIAWSRFQKLKPEDYSEKVFRKIIAEAVEARRTKNIINGVIPRAQHRIARAAADC